MTIGAIAPTWRLARPYGEACSHHRITGCVVGHLVRAFQEVGPEVHGVLRIDIVGVPSPGNAGHEADVTDPDVMAGVGLNTNDSDRALGRGHARRLARLGAWVVSC